MTTTHEFVLLLTADNLDELYTVEEQMKIYEALKAKFALGHPTDNTPHTYCEGCDCCIACDCCVCDGEGGERHECDYCENTFSDAQIDSGEVVPCGRCYKCFVGDCGKTNCDCVFSDDEDKDEVEEEEVTTTTTTEIFKGSFPELLKAAYPTVPYWTYLTKEELRQKIPLLCPPRTEEEDKVEEEEDYEAIWKADTDDFTCENCCEHIHYTVGNAHNWKKCLLCEKCKLEGVSDTRPEDEDKVEEC